MSGALATGLALAVALASAPNTARACKCASPPADPATAFAQADRVVEARVDAHDFVRDVGFRTRLTVTKTHKGDHDKKLVVTAAKTCAVGFKPGKNYLVYLARDGDGGFTTNFCSRTALLTDASEDLAEIAGVAAPKAELPLPPTTLERWLGLLVEHLVHLVTVRSRSR